MDVTLPWEKKIEVYCIWKDLQ